MDGRIDPADNRPGEDALSRWAEGGFGKNLQCDPSDCVRHPDLGVEHFDTSSPCRPEHDWGDLDDAIVLKDLILKVRESLSQLMAVSSLDVRSELVSAKRWGFNDAHDDACRWMLAHFSIDNLDVDGSVGRDTLDEIRSSGREYMTFDRDVRIGEALTLFWDASATIARKLDRLTPAREKQFSELAKAVADDLGTWCEARRAQFVHAADSASIGSSGGALLALPNAIAPMSTSAESNESSSPKTKSLSEKRSLVPINFNEANVMVTKGLKNPKRRSCRTLAAWIQSNGFKCSASLVRKTPAWIAYQREQKAESGPDSKRATNLSAGVIAKATETLEDLQREQQADYEPSPLSPRGRRPLVPKRL